MPCNTDYMYPTQGEISQLHKRELQLKEIADKMVFATDVVRDIILDSKGKLLIKDSYKVITIEGYLHSRDLLEKQGAEALEQVIHSYAHTKGLNTEDVYRRAQSEYTYVLDIAVRFIAGEKIYIKEIRNIEKQQVEHRKGDIQRLILHFADKKDFRMIRTLSSVDFTLPLEPQIGFDPDKY